MKKDEALSIEQLTNLIPSYFRWIISYCPEDALHNIQYLENGIKHYQLDWPIRVFVSDKTAAKVMTFFTLDYVKNPHVKEWYDSFYEISLKEAKIRFKKEVEKNNQI